MKRFPTRLARSSVAPIINYLIILERTNIYTDYSGKNKYLKTLSQYHNVSIHVLNKSVDCPLTYRSVTFLELLGLFFCHASMPLNFNWLILAIPCLFPIPFSFLHNAVSPSHTSYILPISCAPPQHTLFFPLCYRILCLFPSPHLHEFICLFLILHLSSP